MVLAAGFAAIRGAGAGIFAALRRFDKGGIDQGPLPIDLVGAVEFGQQHGMKLEPDTGLVPQAQVVAASLAAAAAEFSGQVVPGDAGLEYEQNARKDLAVVQGLAAGEAEAASWRRGQQRLEALPERIGDEGFHGMFSASSGDDSPDHNRAASVPLDSFFPNALSRTGHR